MNRIIAFLVNLLLLVNFAKSQTQTITTKYFDGEGVIFYDSANFPFKIDDFEVAIKIDSNDILLAEEILIDTLSFNQALLSKNMNKCLRKCNRQYLGYKKRDSNERHIILILLNFSDKKLSDDIFDGWKENVMLGLGEIFERNTALFFVNIDGNNLKR